jgi:hypothetical protein
MESPGQKTQGKPRKVDIAHSSLCEKQHRDLRPWNRQKAECCLSCGSFYDLESSLHIPLKFGDEIRLLQLLPSSDDSDDLIGDLIHLRLQENPIYEAISYTWADEFGVTSHCGNLFIKSGNVMLKITRNCEVALRKFRDKLHTRLLWVDSICIDQRNSLERSEQVQMMTNIYKQAQNVLVFIGHPPEISLDDYRQLFDYMRTKKSYIQDTNSRGLSRGSRGPLYDLISNKSTDFTSKLRLRNTLVKFLDYPWFHRIWVIQEVIMARSVALYFGPFVIDWEDVSLDRFILGSGRGIDDALIPIEHAFKIDIPPVLRLRKKIKSEGARLVDLLSATRTCAATDPRDKIFALLGMAQRENMLQLPRADYTKSVENVFAEATIYYIRSTGCLGILSSPLSPAETTVSWVSNFSDISTLTPFCEEQNYIPRIKAFSETPLIIDDRELDLGFLNATGILLDSITYVQNDQKWIQRTRSRNLTVHPEGFVSSVQQLFQAPSTFQVPLMLLHCPLDPLLAFEEPSVGIDPFDMREIDLLAPFFERQLENYSPHCISTLERFYRTITNYGRGRAIFCGKDTMGIVPVGTEPGDMIWILPTAFHPLVLRQKGNYYKVIGACMIMGPNKHPGCNTRYHGKARCDCRSCKSRKRYEGRNKIEYLSLI